MRFHFATIPLLLTTGYNVNAFTQPSTRPFHAKWTSTSLSSQKSAEILAKARAAVGQDPVPVPDSKFDDDILEDMKKSLLFLEQRVKNGPGSFSKEEMVQFEAATSRIIDEMNAKYIEDETVSPAAASTSEAPSTPVTSESSPPVSVEPPPPPPPMPSLLQQAKKDQKEILQKSEKEEPKQEEDTPFVQDTGNDEGPAYEGEGGMGLAKGTANTYIIDGMEEMTGEEYRKALQDDVTARQAERYKRYKGRVGNNAVNDYLNNL